MLATITDTEELKTEQKKTLASPRRPYGFLANMLFFTMDMVYGKKRTMSKFKVLEIIARVPYQAWEHVAYIAVTHKYSQPLYARRIFDFIRESREQQDNEQWHLLILEEMTQQRGAKEGFFMYRIIPQLIAFFYYHTSWLLYVIDPAKSYRLNADFEDHAEHEYMIFVNENPQFEDEPFESSFKEEYGDFNSVADVLRQIGIDERMHKEESIHHIDHPRFGA